MDLRVIIFQEGDTWAAQCVDYDIGTTGASITEVQQRMSNQLAVEAIFSEEATGAVFGGIPESPQIYKDMWSECGSGLSSNKPLTTGSTPVSINMQLCA